MVKDPVGGMTVDEKKAATATDPDGNTSEFSTWLHDGL